MIVEKAEKRLERERDVSVIAGLSDRHSIPKTEVTTQRRKINTKTDVRADDIGQKKKKGGRNWTSQREDNLYPSEPKVSSN